MFEIPRRASFFWLKINARWSSNFFLPSFVEMFFMKKRFIFNGIEQKKHPKVKFFLDTFIWKSSQIDSVILNQVAVKKGATKLELSSQFFLIPLGKSWWHLTHVNKLQLSDPAKLLWVKLQPTDFDNISFYHKKELCFEIKTLRYIMLVVRIYKVRCFDLQNSHIQEEYSGQERIRAHPSS